MIQLQTLLIQAAIATQISLPSLSNKITSARVSLPRELCKRLTVNDMNNDTVVLGVRRTASVDAGISLRCGTNSKDAPSHISVLRDVDMRPRLVDLDDLSGRNRSPHGEALKRLVASRQPTKFELKGLK